MITNFDQMFEQLRSKPKKRLVAAWGVDDHTISAVYMAVEAGIVEGILVGDEEMIKKVCAENNYDMSKLTVVNNNNELKSISQAVDMVNAGEADILMKGLCSTDKYMRGILNKEKGLLPQGVLPWQRPVGHEGRLPRHSSGRSGQQRGAPLV